MRTKLIIAVMASLALVACSKPVPTKVEIVNQDGADLPATSSQPVAADNSPEYTVTLIAEINGCQVHKITDRMGSLVGYHTSRPDSGACSFGR